MELELPEILTQDFAGGRSVKNSISNLLHEKLITLSQFSFNMLIYRYLHCNYRQNFLISMIINLEMALDLVISYSPYIHLLQYGLWCSFCKNIPKHLHKFHFKLYGNKKTFVQKISNSNPMNISKNIHIC